MYRTSLSALVLLGAFAVPAHAEGDGPCPEKAPHLHVTKEAVVPNKAEDRQQEHRDKKAEPYPSYQALMGKVGGEKADEEGSKLGDQLDQTNKKVDDVCKKSVKGLVGG